MPDIELEYNSHIDGKHDYIRKYRIFLELACMIKVNDETSSAAIESRRTYPYTSMFIFGLMNCNKNLYDFIDINFDEFVSMIDNDIDYACFSNYRDLLVDHRIHNKVKSQVKYKENYASNRYIGTFSGTSYRIVLSRHGFKITSSLKNSCYFSINSGYIKLDGFEKDSVFTKRNYVIERFQFLKTFVSNMDQLIEVEDCYLKDLVHMLKF